MIKMKNAKHPKKMLSKMVKKVIDESLTIDTLGTTCIIYYQPKVPKGMEKFKKKTDDK